MQLNNLPEPPAHRRFIYLIIFIVSIIFIKVIFFSNRDEIAILEVQPPAYRVQVDPDELRLENYRRTQQALKNAEKLLAAEKPQVVAPLKMPTPASDKIRVAAAQIYSALGEVDRNRQKMQIYIERAAQLHTQIIVFPEVALTGYCDLSEGSFWATAPEIASQSEENGFFLDVKNIAETPNGASVKFFAELAKKYQMYIALPYIEIADEKYGEGTAPSVPKNAEQNTEKYYSSLALIAPTGELLLNYRKRKLFPVFDSFWASSGTDEKLVVETPLGKIGLLIGLDLYGVLPLLNQQSADIVLHATAFSGINLERWLNHRYAKVVRENNVNIVLANWGINYLPEWNGYGLSRVITRDGKAIAAVGAHPEERLIIGDLPKAK